MRLIPSSDVESNILRFFDQSNFKTLSPWNLGIGTLRRRLSIVLFDHIRQELPSLIRDIDTETVESQLMLDSLGPAREGLAEQRIFLLDLSERFQAICRSAIDGAYDKDFFEDGLSVAGSEKRLRAVVRNMEMDFAKVIRTRGAQWIITTDRRLSETPGYLTRSQAVASVLQQLKSSRGLELPGLPNPRLVGILFRQYSSPWDKLAQDHIREIWNAVKRFLERVLLELTTESVCDALFKLRIDPILDKALELAFQKLNELLHTLREFEPMTTNHYFTETAEKYARRRQDTQMRQRLERLFSNRDVLQREDIELILSAMNDTQDADMDAVAAERAFDYMWAFYKVSRSPLY